MDRTDRENGSSIPSDQSVSRQTTTVTEEDGTVVTTKTIYITNSHKVDGVNTIQKIYNSQDGAISPDDRDINFVRRNSKRRSLNKEAYIKLHKNITNRKSIEVLKGKYEPQRPTSESDIVKINGNEVNRDNPKDDNTSGNSESDSSWVILRSKYSNGDLQSRLSSRLSEDTVELLKVKYSPSSFGYANTELTEKQEREKPKLPQKPKLAEKPKLPEKPKRIPPIPPVRTSTLSRHTTQKSHEFETQPAHEVILRSSSEDSIEKLETFMSEFTMEPKREAKEKKRTSSFRKILTGSLFSKDKKKSGEKKGNEEKTRSKKTENIVVADNAQNEETCNKNPAQRNSIDNHYSKQPKKANIEANAKKEYIDSTTNNLNEMERKYAEMHINQFNKIKASFSNPESFSNHPNDSYHYVHQNDNTNSTIDKYIDTSSSSNTLESIDRSTYQNALIAQAELQQMREKELMLKQNISKQTDIYRNQQTPPRAKETHQNVQLVKPKALIPINSERALPNPYHNGQEEISADNIKKSTERNLDIDEKDYATKIPIYNRQNDLNDVAYEYSTNKMQLYQGQRQYSPNLTKSSTTSSSNQNSPSSPSFSPRSSPRSPTLEGSKLRLPSNREKVNLQPRIKSPIPQPKVSTEKIIATELLKNKTEFKKNEKLLPLNQQKLGYDYVDSNIYEPKPVNTQIVRQSPTQTAILAPPEIRSAADAFEAAKWHQKQRELANSPTLTDSTQVLTDVMVHADPNLKRNSLQYSSLPVSMRKPNQEIVNLRQRPVTPVKRVPSTASLQQSPQKHEIRQSVELYCWKEIQKMKEKQDQELKYQLQYTPQGCVEDPIIQRRSRSVEPVLQRNTKRSTSLPREAKPNMNARTYYREPIPENSPIVYKEHDLYAQKNPNFLRNSPQRRTISSTSSSNSQQLYDGYYTNSGEVPYRPIFNRGSLSPQIQPETPTQLQKKVSFNGNRYPTQQHSWPTRNGYVQSPPQRRIEKTMSVGDDEVFLRDSQIKQMNEQIQKQMMKDVQYSARDSVTSLPRQVNLEESPYGTRVPVQNNIVYTSRPQEKIVSEPLYVTRQNKQNVTELTKQKQENLQNIYGTKQQPDIDPLLVRQNYPSRNQELILVQDVRDGGSVIHEPIYGSKQQPMNERYYSNNVIAESPYGTRRFVATNPVAKVTKQVTITNKVCDIYGNIHDNGNKMLVAPTNNGQIQQTGVIYGQLQGNVVGRPPQYQSYNQIPSNFVRGTRLTASANDMHRRYPNDIRYREVVYEERPHSQHAANFNPNAPLPPTPNESKLQFLMMRRNNANKTYPHMSDTESDTSEVRRIMNRNYNGGNGTEEYRRPSITVYETKYEYNTEFSAE